MDYASAILTLHPDADPLTDFVIQDDGNGPYIAHWNEDTLGPQPTLAELDAVELPPRLLTQSEFIQRFTQEEQAAIMTTPGLAPLALAVLAAPSRMVDVTDETAQLARAALKQAGWGAERLEALFVAL